MAKHERVSVAEFLSNPYYLGEYGNLAYAPIQEDLELLFDPARGYQEYVTTGGLGTGKTYACSLGVCYALYELSLMDNPQEALGVAPDTEISLTSFSCSEDHAREVVLKTIIAKLSASEYFKENFSFKVTQCSVKFPNNIVLTARAATTPSVLGKNTYLAWFDEYDFIKGRESETMSTARVVYDCVKRRMYSRFGPYGRIFISSMKRGADTEMDAFKWAAIFDGKMLVRDRALWDLHPERFSGETFPVLVGNARVSSTVLTEEEAKRFAETPIHGCSIIRVPVELYEECKSDPAGTLRDVGGYAV